MKKWCVLTGVFLFSIFIFTSKSEKTNTVFEENNWNEFRLVKIDVSNASITTKNIIPFLHSVTLYKVTYEVPKLYKSKFLNKNLEYFFFGISNEEGLEAINKQLMLKMKALGNTKEVEKISFYGVKIHSIEVYGNVQKIEELKQKLKDY